VSSILFIPRLGQFESESNPQFRSGTNNRKIAPATADDGGPRRSKDTDDLATSGERQERLTIYNELTSTQSDPMEKQFLRDAILRTNQAKHHRKINKY
jgi:hypothetical protein